MYTDNNSLSAYLGLSILAVVCSCAGALAEDIAIVNTCSQVNRLPACIPVTRADDLAQADAVRVSLYDSQVRPVDVYDDMAYVLAGVNPMAGQVFEPADGSPLPSATARQLRDGLHIMWHDRTYVRGASDGLHMGTSHVLHMRGQWQAMYVGRGLTVLACDDMTVWAYESGAATVSTTRQLGIAPAVPQSTDSVQIRLDNEFLVARPIRDVDRIERATCSIYIPGVAVLVPEQGSRWTWHEGRLIPDEDGMRMHISPCTTIEQWSTAAASVAAFPLAGSRSNDQWRFEKDGYTAQVHLLGTSESPTLDDELWVWRDSKGKLSSAWVCTSADRSEPLLEYFDLHKRAQDANIVLHSASGDLTVEGTPLAAPASGNMIVQPDLVFESYVPWGRFLQGSLLTGGALLSSSVNGYQGLTLDDDGDVDVYVYPGDTNLFDMLDNMPGFWGITAGEPGTLSFSINGGYTTEIGRYNWMFRKTYLEGRQYQGAGRGFEEHLLYRIKSTDDEEVGGPAIFFFKTTNDKIDRLSMGAFGEGDDAYMAWNIELDPLETTDDQEPAYRICEYRSITGKVVRFTSCVYPQTWDGKALPFRMIDDKTLDFTPYTPWYSTAKENMWDLKGLHMAMWSEGGFYHSTEGMYGGSLSSGMRIERDNDGATFVLYYSDLMGGLHLKGADYGYQGFDASFPTYHPGIREVLYHHEAVDMPDRFFGGREVGDWEGARMEGPLYLGYLDNNDDGYMDTYLYDADNNGMIDRAVYYNEQDQLVRMADGDRTTVWPYADERIEVDYLIDNYNRIEQLYLDGANLPPLVVRASLADSGLPIVLSRRRTGNSHVPAVSEQRPKRFFIFEPEWLNTITLDLAHGGQCTSGYRQFDDHGFSGLALHATALGLKGTHNTGTLSLKTLEHVDVLVLPQPLQPMTSDEFDACMQWVRAGGVLFVVPTDDNEPSRIIMEGLGKALGSMTLSDNPLHARSSIYKYGLHGGDWTDTTAAIEEKRVPSPLQDISHYSAADPTLLEGLQYITCVGYPLQCEDLWQPVLSYDGKTMIAEMSMGDGRIVFSGMNIFANRYINHIQYIEPESNNPELLQRLLAYSIRDVPMLATSDYTGRHNQPRWGLTVTGKGGRIKIPQSYYDRDITVNNKPAAVRHEGLFDIVSLPAGTSTLHITETTR